MERQARDQFMQNLIGHIKDSGFIFKTMENHLSISNRSSEE